MSNKFMIRRSRDLRQRMTLPEKILWQFLRASSFAGLRFRRQHPIGSYVVDFFCPQKKLVVELDGKYHDTFKPEDANRDNILQKQGFIILHFTNDQVFEQVEWILQTIADELAIDWGKSYHDCIAQVKYPRKLYALLKGIQKYRENHERDIDLAVKS